MSNYTGYDFRIEDVHESHLYGWVPTHPNLFKVYIFAGDKTVDVKSVKRRLNELRQSHTAYSLQERINYIIDQSELERIEAFRMLLRMAVYFWGQQSFLDGTSLLDGSKLLNTVRRYDLIPRIVYRGEIPTADETFAFPRMIWKTCAKISEEISASAILGPIAADFWGREGLNGAALLDGRKLLDGSFRYKLIPVISYRMDVPAADEFLAVQRILWKTSVKIAEKIAADIVFGPISLDFWNRETLNGCLPLNGLSLLGRDFRYDLIPGLKYIVGGPALSERFIRPQARLHINIPKKLGVHGGVSFSGWAALWNRLLLDGSIFLDGGRTLDGSRRSGKAGMTVGCALPKVLEKTDHVTLTTSTRDSAFLDSSLALDGSRRLNSIYRKEDL